MKQDTTGHVKLIAEWSQQNWDDWQPWVESVNSLL